MLKAPILLGYMNNLRRSFNSNIALLAMEIYPINKLMLFILYVK